MPAVLSLLLVLVVLYAFALFVRTASPYQMGRVLGSFAFLIIIVGLLFLAVTGRLPLAILVLIVLWPFMAGYYEIHKRDLIRRHGKHPDSQGQKKEKIKNDFEENS